MFQRVSALSNLSSKEGEAPFVMVSEIWASNGNVKEVKCFSHREKWSAIKVKSFCGDSPGMIFTALGEPSASK